MTEEQIHSNNGSYSAENIQVLEGLEAVRKRPAMYIGDISSKGLHHLVYEVVDNSIDEALAGYCDHIEVTINEDNSITVQDNGRGIPVDYHEKEKKSALEVVMTVLHAGGKFDKGSYKVSGGLHGVGVSCVNALSTHMTTQVFRNGKIYQQEYSCGHPLYSVKEVGTTDITGTRQQFWPDGSIFITTTYKYEILANRMRELAFLNAGITITLTDMREKDENGVPRSETFHSKDGLKEFVRYIDSSRIHLFNDVIYLNTEKQGVPIEVAIMYNTSYNENVHSFPAFMEIGLRLGVQKFSYYLQGFGLTEKTGIDLPGEVSSVVVPEDKMTQVDLASGAYGQTNETTALELITAYSAAINGGYVVEPYVVDHVIDSSGNTVLQNTRTVKRQIVSEETSQTVREQLEAVVSGNPSHNAYVQGYRIGGKSGTAEIRVTRDIEDDHVASYCCFAPADDPELIMLIQADYPNPEIGYYGSKVVTPYAQEIMEEILPYMGFYPEYTDEEAKEMNVSVPLLQDATLDTAKSTLEQLGLTYEVVGSGSSVISQSPTTGTSIVKGGKVLLYTEQNATPDLVSVPNLVGMTASQANETMAYYGLNYALVGASASSEGALVKSQSVPEGTQIQRGSSVTLTLSAGEATD